MMETGMSTKEKMELELAKIKMELHMIDMGVPGWGPKFLELTKKRDDLDFRLSLLEDATT